MNKLIVIFLMLLSPLISMAQDDVEMASVMRENGKIYVVVGVLSIVFIGIIIYLIAIDRKVNKLQKRLEEK